LFFLTSTYKLPLHISLPIKQVLQFNYFQSRNEPFYMVLLTNEGLH